ncbi:MAG TPA: 4a-hydroxytetrahydrobiopterin dehydratase [Bacillales bacterium]|nr:4a-hydroxytetrahydrobiopterin dehydratase [Bacillales bacterium]
MEKLSETQIEEALKNVEGWKRTDQKWIQKRFRFKAFLRGVTFVNRIAELSEEVDHHPFISIDYRVVTLKLSSWHAGGLTDLDFELAGKYNGLYEAVLTDKEEA